MRPLFIRSALLVAALALAVPGAHAQSVDEIIAKNIEAKGGESLLKSTTSVRTTGVGTVQGAQVTLQSMNKRPNLMRNEMEMAGQKMVQGFDGETLWMSMGGMPPQAMPPGPTTDAMKQSSQIDSPLVDYKAKGLKVELGEPLADGATSLTHLVVTPKTGPTMHYYLDPATNLERRMVMNVEEGGQKMKMEIRFSDYRTVEGRKVPFAVTQFVNDNPVMEMKFEKIEFNVPLDDSLFRMPSK